MKYIIKHEIRGRLRIHVVQGKMTCAEADILFWYLDRQKNITDVKVYERTADVTAEVYDLNHFPQLRERYHVMSVPCLAVNDGDKVDFGKKDIRQLAELLESQGK